MVELILVQCNLVHNQYQWKSESLCTFMSNKSYDYFSNAEPSNLFGKNDFDKINTTFTDQNGRSLEIKGKVNFALFTNK